MEDLDILIVQYLNGKLKGRELQEFEGRLQEDQDLQKELRLHQTIEGSLQKHFQNRKNEEALRTKIKSLSAGIFQEEKARGPEPESSEPVPKQKTRSSRIRPVIFAVLATAAAILLLLWAPWQSSLYTRYATHPIAAFTEMNRSAGELSRAEQAFNSKDYAMAANLLEPYLQDHPDNAEIQYYLGISRLETGQYAEAERLFGELLQGNSVYRNEGAWYLALSSLKQKLPVRAREYLEQIPEGSDRFEKAQKLLNDL